MPGGSIGVGDGDDSSWYVYVYIHTHAHAHRMYLCVCACGWMGVCGGSPRWFECGWLKNRSRTEVGQKKNWELGTGKGKCIK